MLLRSRAVDQFCNRLVFQVSEMPRPSIGSIVEIPVDGAFAYAQITHRHPKWGFLLRIFDSRLSRRPHSFVETAEATVQFSTFYPVATGERLGLVRVVGKVPVSAKNAEWPVFKAGMRNSATGKIENWWLWDGEREWNVGTLTAAQRKLPYREIVTGDLLHNRIRAGWTDEHESF